MSPSELIAKSDIIAIVRLETISEAKDSKAVRATATILKAIKGQEGQTTKITLLYPPQNFEEANAYVIPQAGKVLLVFLKRRDGDIYVATSAVSQVSFLEDDNTPTVQEKFFETQGAPSFKSTTETEASKVADLLLQFLQWDKFNDEQKAEFLVKSLSGPQVIKRIILDWLIMDQPINFNKREEIPNQLIDILLANIKSQDSYIQQKSLQLIGMIATQKKGLIPYIVDALDFPATQTFAVYKLAGNQGRGPGPELNFAAKVAENAAILIKWWRETGSKNPDFKRYIPAKAETQLK